MQVELRVDWDPGEVLAVADLFGVTGEVGAKIVLSTNLLALPEDAVDEDRITAETEELIYKTVRVLAVLGLSGHVRFMRDADPHSETGKAITRALEKVPDPVVIGPQLVEAARLDRADAARKTREIFEALSKEKRKEGLRRGLTKEEREKTTLGELFDLKGEE